MLLWFCIAAHTPDNSFMGFVAEELNQTEILQIQRQKVNNMAVIYGKEASMWKVSFPPPSSLSHSSCNVTADPIEAPVGATLMALSFMTDEDIMSSSPAD